MTIVEDRPVHSDIGGMDFSAARKAMIDGQLRVSGVNADFVLARMGTVPREDFVPAGARNLAYMDRAIALDGGRFLAAPLVQGMMLDEAKPHSGDKALLVDGGSGYLAELLRPLVGSLETLAPEDAPAKGRKPADVTLLVIDGAIEQLPEALARRLAEGGRVVTGLVMRGLTRLAVGRKAAGKVALVPLAEIGIPALPEFAAPRGWSF
jgi:protein-L-isoaspartate(D-aspartate) O-methyltransferase